MADEVSLKEYVDARFESISRETALTKSDLDKRLEAMNEFRQALRDQNQTFVTKPEHEFVMKDIRELRESRAELAGKASQQSVTIVYLISGLSLLVAIVSLLKQFL